LLVLRKPPARGDDRARSAVAALEAVVDDERPLHRMKLPVRGEPRGRDDLGAVVGNSERETPVDPPAVEQDRAGTALPVVAALLRTGDAAALAHGAEQPRPGIHRKPVRPPVNLQRDPYFHSASLIGSGRPR